MGPVASSPLRELNRIQYGYLWRSINYPYKDRVVRAFFAAGNGGQAIMVVPELDGHGVIARGQLD